MAKKEDTMNGVIGLPRDIETTRDLEDFLESTDCRTVPHADRDQIILDREHDTILVVAKNPVDVYDIANYIKKEVEGGGKKYAVSIHVGDEYALLYGFPQNDPKKH